MQVFVWKSDLVGGDNECVRVVATYDDGSPLSATLHGQTATLFSLSPASVVRRMAVAAIAAAPERMPSGFTFAQKIPAGAEFGITVLAVNWRVDDKALIVSSEATRRIYNVFSQHSQQNSAAEMTDNLVKYGTDLAKWPSDVLAHKAEIDRAWKYVEAVRKRAINLAAVDLPVDPSADRHWPTRISPYQPQ